MFWLFWMLAKNTWNLCYKRWIRKYERIAFKSIGFPLYIGSIPSHFLRNLIALEKYMKLHTTKSPLIYCIVINGFYEGTQTHLAIEQIQHWCKRANATFAQAIGSGSGDMLNITKDIPMGHGPNTMIGKALQKMADNILNCNTDETIFGSPNFPRIGWKIMANELFFCSQAKENGLKRKDLKQLPMNTKETFDS